jgi:hypothetical protein
LVAVCVLVPVAVCVAVDVCVPVVPVWLVAPVVPVCVGLLVWVIGLAFDCVAVLLAAPEVVGALLVAAPLVAVDVPVVGAVTVRLFRATPPATAALLWPVEPPFWLVM